MLGRLRKSELSDKHGDRLTVLKIKFAIAITANWDASQTQLKSLVLAPRFCTNGSTCHLGQRKDLESSITYASNARKLVSLAIIIYVNYMTRVRCSRNRLEK